MSWKKNTAFALAAATAVCFVAVTGIGEKGAPVQEQPAVVQEQIPKPEPVPVVEPGPEPAC